MLICNTDQWITSMRWPSLILLASHNDICSTNALPGYSNVLIWNFRKLMSRFIQNCMCNVRVIVVLTDHNTIYYNDVIIASCISYITYNSCIVTEVITSTYYTEIVDCNNFSISPFFLQRKYTMRRRSFNCISMCVSSIKKTSIAHNLYLKAVRLLA